jgi:hypothetical protein
MGSSVRNRRLVMTLLVRDEEDIVRDNIDFHLNHGVDFIIATDNGSVDSTPELLESYERKGVLRLLHEPQDDYSQHAWVTRMARMAATEYGADWVINNDADEFWWSKTGDLKSQLCGLTASDAVQVRRFNFLQDDAASPGAPYYERLVYRDNQSINAVGHNLPGKTCHRASSRIEVMQGNHSVVLDGRTVDAPVHDGIEILHFPARRYEQFSNKIRLGGAAYERNTTLDRTVGGTWRHLYREMAKGRLFDAYRSQSTIATADSDDAERFVLDTRLRDELRRLRSMPHIGSAIPHGAQVSITQPLP